MSRNIKEYLNEKAPQMKNEKTVFVIKVAFFGSIGTRDVENFKKRLEKMKPKHGVVTDVVYKKS